MLELLRTILTGELLYPTVVCAVVFLGVGVATTWAVCSGRHWFLRMAVVGAALAPALLIPGYDLVLMFATQAAVLWGWLTATKLMRLWAASLADPNAAKETAPSPRAWVRFRLRDLLLLAAVLVVLLVVTARVPGYEYTPYFGVLAVLLWVALTPIIKLVRLQAAHQADPDAAKQPGSTLRARLRFTLSDLLLGTAVLSAVLAVASRVPAGVWAEWKGIGLLGLVFAMYSILIPETVLFASGRERLGTYPARKQKKKRGRIAVVLLSVLYPLMMCLAMLLLCPAAAIFHFVIHPTPVPPIALPDPNGYDDLVRAGSRLVNVTVPEVGEATAAELRQFLTEHGHVLDEAREGLLRECQVPLTYTPADLTRTDDTALRALGRTFLAEGKLAEREGRTEDAVDDYLDLLRLGTACTQGGLVGDTLTGWAFHEMGVQALASLAEKLDADQCRKAVELARSIEANREPLEGLFARESLWDEHAYGKTGRALQATGLNDFGDGPVRDAVKQSAKRSQAKMRLLICELAVRQYRLEHGREPEGLPDLVPGCLPDLPVDPYSGGPLLYRRTESGHLLYSVGPDRADNGGERIDWSSGSDHPRGDLLLEEPEREEPPQPSARPQ